MEELIRAYQEVSMVVNIASIAITVFTIVCMWKVFTKAGEGGWKILIPIYNVYIQFKIANAKKRFWVCLLLTLAIPVILATVLGDIIYEMQMLGAFAMTSSRAIRLLAVLILALVIFIINVTVNFSMAKAFGLPGIFGLGLWLLPIIFYAIIAFSGSIQYASRRRHSRYLEE